MTYSLHNRNNTQCLPAHPNNIAEPEPNRHRNQFSMCIRKLHKVTTDLGPRLSTKHPRRTERLAFAMTSESNPTVYPLQGKVAIVTGASRGIGAGLALELARRGAKVGRTQPMNPNSPLTFMTGHTRLHISQEPGAS